MSKEMRDYIRSEYEALQDEVDNILRRDYGNPYIDYKSDWYEIFNTNWDYLVIELMNKFDLCEEDILSCIA